MDTNDFRISCVTVHCETMADTINAKMTRDTTKSKYWEAPVAVIWLYYLSDIPKCALILVVLAKIVKRTL